jgi:hypothetical protein
MAYVLSSPLADACAGSVGVRLFQPPDVPEGMSGQRQHGSRCNRQGASPRRLDDLRGVVHMPTSTRLLCRAASRRPAVRGRGRGASGEHEVRRQADERLGRGFPDQQPTGRSGHGLADVPSHEAGCHRRTPHGRAFACGSRSSQHHDSNQTAARLCAVPQAIVIQWSGFFYCLEPPSHDAGKSLRSCERSANLFPKKLKACTSRAVRASISAGRDEEPQNQLAGSKEPVPGPRSKTRSLKG